MRWALAGSETRVGEAHSWEECCRELEASPASVLGLELRHDNVEQVVQWLLTMRERFPAARAVILLASRSLRRAFALLYEAGAVHVAESTRNLDATGRLVVRLVGNAARSQPDYQQTVYERIPW